MICKCLCKFQRQSECLANKGILYLEKDRFIPNGCPRIAYDFEMINNPDLRNRARYESERPIA